jgi:phosphoglycerate dehydrogenase-like enzyme
VVHLRAELAALLAASDYVVLAVPLAEETRHVIDAAALAHMRPTAALISVARGAVVDEDALCNALSERLLGAAYIDCPTQLPPPPWSRLYRTRNVVLTHHSSASGARVLEEAFERFAAGVRALTATGTPPDLVL